MVIKIVLVMAMASISSKPNESVFGVVAEGSHTQHSAKAATEHASKLLTTHANSRSAMTVFVAYCVIAELTGHVVAQVAAAYQPHRRGYTTVEL